MGAAYDFDVALKRNANKGHKNKRSAYNEAVEILSKRVTTLCDLSLSKGFPHRFDGKFHPYLTSNPRIPCQYCMWHEQMLDPSARKFVPGAKKMRTSGGNLVCPVKRVKSNYNGVMQYIICNVELCPDCFNNFHGIDTSDYHKFTKS